MSDGSKLKRRNVLRGAAAAGMASVGATGLAAGQSDAQPPWEELETETVSEAVFAEIGIVFDGDLPSTDEACRAKPYHIDEQEGFLFLPVLPEEDREIVSANDAVARHNGIQALPTKVTRSEVEFLPTSINGRLAPRAAAPVEEPVRIPAMHFDTDAEDAVTVKIGGSETEVGAGETERVPLSPVPAKVRKRRNNRDSNANENGRGRGNGGAVEATPEVVVNNYGRLQFEVAAKTEGSA